MADKRLEPMCRLFVTQESVDLRPAIFLDRDGVINRNRSDYVKSWAEFVFLPGSLEAIKWLSMTDYWIVVVTNQSAIGRGIVTAEAVDDIHRRMVEAVRSAGGRIDAVVTCPHRPDEGCLCRKPAPGMIWETARQLPVDIFASYFIGDAESDIVAARAAGVRPVLVLSGRTVAERMLDEDVTWNHLVVQPDLRAAVRWIGTGR